MADPSLAHIKGDPDVECPHGLTFRTCSICRTPPAQRGEVGQVVYRVGHAVEARFGGQCRECNLGIHVGQSIVQLNTGPWVHARCAP